MRPLRVLVTDDELGMRKGVQRILRDFAVEVPEVNEQVTFVCEEADSGEAGLQKIAEDPPDILILDHKMPGISGIDVLDQLVERNSEVLTIMITGYASIETAVMATRRGAYDFLAKPFTPEELRTRVRKAAIHVVLSQRARQLARERREVRLQFTRMLAHELQAPLNAIDGYLDLMKNRIHGHEVAAYEPAIGRSQTRLEGMRKLIRDLLDMTQIESGRRKRQLALIDLEQVAQASIETHAAAAGAAQVSLTLAGDSAGSMVADRDELNMIFNNLISNAIKYNHPGGCVEVSLTRSESQIAISVEDTGIGISEDAVETLFQEFTRIQNAETHGILGSGLGLSIVKKIAQLYKGNATLVSQPGIGSTFTVTLCDDATFSCAGEVEAVAARSE